MQVDSRGVTQAMLEVTQAHNCSVQLEVRETVIQLSWPEWS